MPGSPFDVEVVSASADAARSVLRADSPVRVTTVARGASFGARRSGGAKNEWHFEVQTRDGTGYSYGYTVMTHIVIAYVVVAY